MSSPAVPRDRFADDFAIKPIETEQERRQFSDLLNVCFPSRPGASFLDDFPVWNLGLRPPGFSDIFILGGWKGEQLVAAAGLRLTELNLTKDQILPIALLGAVCVKEGYRGMGLASRICASLLKLADSQGIPATFLWGSEHSLYQRLGFELCGQQVCLPISDLFNYSRFSENASLTNAEVQHDFTPGVFAATLKRKSGLRLSQNDWNWLAAHRGTQWYWTGDRANPSAYAALGRGIDLPNMVHEYGGSAEEIKRLLHWIGKQNPEAKWIGSPAQARRLEFPYSADTIQFLCMARVIDPVVIAKGLGLGASLTKKIAEQSAKLWPELLFGGAAAPPSPSSALGQEDLADRSLWFWGLDGA